MSSLKAGMKSLDGIGIGLSYSKLTSALSQVHNLTLGSRDGDLSASANSPQLNALYSFDLESNSSLIMQLPERLDLGVSDVGIIGRRISVMTGSTQEPLTVAEGIIGWN